ncbi:MAG: transposase [Alphaproteobacteria bacterium]|nr:transposase [Alphaproteobacteria bacterium]
MPLVFCVKYKYRALCGDITERGIEVIREVCAVNYVDLINVNLDHVYILISVPPHLSEYIKCKSSGKL